MTRLVVAGLCAIFAHGARGQQACPPHTGLSIRTSSGDTTSAPPTTPAPSSPFNLDARAAIDTAWHFDIALREWSRPSFEAAITAALGDDKNPGGLSQGRWRACAGVAVTMQRPTLTVRGVHGDVRFKADLRSLTSKIGTTRPDTARNSRR